MVVFVFFSIEKGNIMPRHPCIFFLLVQILITAPSLCSLHVAERKVYIAYMGSYHGGGTACDRFAYDAQTAVHLKILRNITEEQGLANKLLIHSYTRSFRGFSAYLSETEAKKLSGIDGVVSVFPSTSYKTRTTRSWDFLGFPLNVSRRTSSESNIIIGVIDTGIWPEHESFSDKGLGPPPTKWKGSCQSSELFQCNNKIVGARYYKGRHLFQPGESKSPRDTDGHGTHMAATAAGREVVGASMFGVAGGVARGGVPSARIAVYKACWVPLNGVGCAAEDVLAAFDDAIADNVDVIVSAIDTDDYTVPYFRSAMAIGSFHAMQKGILTSAAASDYGSQGPFTVANIAPWFLTVGASSIDRKFMHTLVLGDGRSYVALELNPFDSHKELLPLIYAGDAPNTGANFTSSTSNDCRPHSLDRALVEGKIVVCEGHEYWTAREGAIEAGAAGCIFSSGDRRYPCEYDDHMVETLPSFCLAETQHSQVKHYIRSVRKPSGRVSKSHAIDDPEAPTVSSFSAVGPSVTTPDILKPDVTAPGVGILSAWPPRAPRFVSSGDTRSAAYNMVFGTSAACAHAAAVAAYVKSYHPTWSPAAIRSALMTTALPLDPTENRGLLEAAYGAGQIQPSRVLDPGLVYDAREQDYVRQLCLQGGYDTQTLRALTGDLQVCSDVHTTVKDLNYPAISVLAKNTSTSGGEAYNATFWRTVTNVGTAESTYRVIVHPNAQGLFEVQVEPKELSFTSLYEKRSFSVRIRGKGATMGSASIVWTDGRHHVRSPIFAYHVGHEHKKL